MKTNNLLGSIVDNGTISEESDLSISDIDFHVELFFLENMMGYQMESSNFDHHPKH